jgi:hypothetical protein
MRRFCGFSRCAARLLSCSLALGLSGVLSAPAAHAEDLVTYEVVSDDLAVANVEFESASGRVGYEGVQLPWRAEVPVSAVRAAPPDGSQVRADWRPNARPFRWVTVRIIYQGKVICESTLDIGNATCYGITPRIPQ